MKFLKNRRTGFTLVELIIVVAIVILLAVVSVPIYRGYDRTAKMTEGYALLEKILTSQKAYFRNYGMFLHPQDSSNTGYTCREAFLDIDARGNKYITAFKINVDSRSKSNLEKQFTASVVKPSDLVTVSGKPTLRLIYKIASGSTFQDNKEY